MKRLFLLLLIFSSLLGFSVLAQDAPQATDEATTDLEVEGSEFLVLAEVALGTGWPGYQRYNINFGVQKDLFGVNLRGSFTEAGPYVNFSGRYFLPIPIPVPTFVSAGGGFFSDSPVGMTTIGAQVPFGLSNPFRLTIEAGAAFGTSLAGDLEILPTASLTLGYTFFFETSPPDQSVLATTSTGSGGGVCVPGEPDYSQLSRALDRKINAELAKAKVKYSGVYNLGGYSYTATDKKESGNTATWEGTWRGSATEVLTGNRTSGNGTWKANFTWTGCGWSVNASLN